MKRQTLSHLTILITSLFATAAFADTQIWTGLGTDQNWSTGNNWTNATAATAGSAPGSADDVQFFDSGFLTPTVDGSFAGTIGSLRFGSTNNDYTTTISSGKILSLTGTGGFRIGTPGDSATALVRTATFTGSGGTLSISNTAANLVLNQGSSTVNGSQAILNLQGLDNFNADINGIGIGTVRYQNTVAQRNAGTLYLAKTNLIVLRYAQPLSVFVNNAGSTNALELVHVGNGNNASARSYLYLGITNAIYVDSIGIGRSKSSSGSAATMMFDPAVIASSPVAYLRGAGGNNSRITWWAAGDMASDASTAQHAVGTNNFTGGRVDALVDTMSLGRDCAPNHGASGSGRINTGVLTFDNGLIDVNTLIVGNQSLAAAASTSVTPNQGFVNVNSANATLVVNSTLKLADTSTQTHTGAQQTFGRVNINGGTLRANTVTVGANTVTNAIIDLSNSATFVLSNTLASISKPLRTLNMSDSTFVSHLGGASTVAFVTNLFTAGSGNTIVIGSSATFSSYPAQVAVFKFVNLSNNVSGAGTHNFTLGSVPANVLNASLSNNTFNSSIDLYIPTDPRPVITNQPNSFSGLAGSNVTFTVGVAGIPPFGYQWRRTGTNISDSGNVSGTTTDTLSVNNAQTLNNGNYTVVITNLYGSITSSVAILDIGTGAPSISGPANQSVLQDSTAILTASVSGVPTPAIQWYKNGSVLPSETSSTLTIANAQYPADEATYSIVATNVNGQATNSAFLTVLVPPGISSEPTSVTVALGSPASFTVVATGHPNPTYQWSKNLNTIPNQTNATLSFASAVPSDAGSYAVLINNAGGSTNSVTVTLAVTSTTLTRTNLTPANNATGLCYDTPLYIRFNENAFLGTGTLRIYDTNNTLVDTIDLSTTYPNGSQIRSIGGETYVTYPVILRSNIAAIFPHLGLLTSNMQYYVLMDTGFFKDSVNASLTGISSPSTWTFTTKAVGPDTSATNITVAGDGSGDFLTVQGAIDWVPAGNTTPITILLKKGSYEEICRIPSGKNNLTFVGEGCLESMFTYANNSTLQGLGFTDNITGRRILFYAGGNDCTFKNLWFDNSTPQGGSQAESIRVQGGRIILDNCKFTSFQDTILINTANTSAGYFNKCLIAGDVDFIWGSGIGFFDKCEVRAMQRSGNSGGIYTQARSGAGVYGLIFRDCDLTKSAPSVTNNWTLGRDGGNGNPYGNVAWLNCRMDDHISGPGWTDGGLVDKSTLRFWEYLSRNITDTAFVNTNSRVAWSLQLDAPTAETVSNPTNVFASILWEPTLPAYVACPPTNQTAYLGSTVIIDTHLGGFPSPVQQWYKGATPVTGATNEILVIANAQGGDAGNYSVRTTNSLGFEISSVGTLTLVPRPSLGTPTVLGNGNVQFTFSGISGTGYRVWASTNVALTPVTGTWTLLNTGTFTASPVTFTDTQATSFSQRYYILTLP